MSGNSKTPEVESSDSTVCYDDPESQETLDDWYSMQGMDSQAIATKIDDVMAELRKAAGDLVRSWFMKRGYFNGRAESFVNREDDSIQCKIVVSCYGLPELLSPDRRSS